MTELVVTDGWELNTVAESALKLAGRFWFVTTVLGQWLFAAYVMAFYGGAAMTGDWAAWNTVFPRGHVPGDTLGNGAVALHLLLAVIILLGGPLQLVPQLRARFPAVHRWSGRTYLLAVCATSLAGLYMVWLRAGPSPGTGDLVQHLGISLDALLILVFAGLALRYALKRDFGAHQRFVLRLFMVVSAVWFFRVGLMLWLVIHKAPVGFDPETFTGPFLNFLSFADYLLPLAVLEIYLRVKANGTAAGRIAMATGLFVLTLALGMGIFAAAMGMWLPRI